MKQSRPKGRDFSDFTLKNINSKNDSIFQWGLVVLFALATIILGWELFYLPGL